MNRIKKLKYIKLRTLLAITFLSLSIVPIILMGLLLFYILRSQMIDLARKNLIENVRKSNIIIDDKLSNIKNSSQLLNVDEDLFSVFSNIDPKSEPSLMDANRKIKLILAPYFSEQEGEYSVNLVTSYFKFGDDNLNFYPSKSFINSKLAKQARAGRGSLVWIPTYNYTSMFGISDLSNNMLEYSRLFSAVRQLNISTAKNGEIQRLPSSMEEPIFVINFKEDYLLSLLQKYSDYSNLKSEEFSIIARDGEVVCHSGSGAADTRWIRKIPEKNTIGSLITSVSGNEKIVCYSIDDETGWIVSVALPSSTFTTSVIREITGYIMVTVILLIILSLLASYIISHKINNKFYRTLHTIDLVENGKFGESLKYSELDEFAFFYRKVNKMSQNLKTLIHENYEVRIRQKDFEIMALNIQLNPHFLYNTLNIINWICLSGDTNRASNMVVDLSRMLQYTSNNDSDLSLLKDDLEWLRQYIDIMSTRYEEKYTVRFDIADDIQNVRVPKLFLQPLVENSIIHGFGGIQRQGVLTISGMRSEDYILFSVEDNGIGMTQKKIDEIMHFNKSSIGIKNTDKRIKILFGKQYGLQIYSQPGEGTIVIVKIPENIKNDNI